MQPSDPTAPHLASSAIRSGTRKGEMPTGYPQWAARRGPWHGRSGRCALKTANPLESRAKRSRCQLAHQLTPEHTCGPHAAILHNLAGLAGGSRHQQIGARLHTPFLSACHVVETEKMQKTVREQHGRLTEQIPPRRGRLPPRRR